MGRPHTPPSRAGGPSNRRHLWQLAVISAAATSARCPGLRTDKPFRVRAGRSADQWVNMQRGQAAALCPQGGARSFVPGRRSSRAGSSVWPRVAVRPLFWRQSVPDSVWTAGGAVGRPKKDNRGPRVRTAVCPFTDRGKVSLRSAHGRLRRHARRRKTAPSFWDAPIDSGVSIRPRTGAAIESRDSADMCGV